MSLRIEESKTVINPTVVERETTLVASTLTQLRSFNPDRTAAFYNGSLWVYTLGDFTKKLDDYVVVKQNDTPLSIGAWVRTGPVLTPEMFGAQGDGVTDDTAAFKRLQATIRAQGGCALQFRTGATYIAGSQLPFSEGARFAGQHVLDLPNITYFICDINGATLKMKGGMYLGSFTTDLTPTTASPNYNISQIASIGAWIRVVNADLVDIRNGLIDCNGGAQIVGGPWGDIGTQCSHYGLLLYSNRQQNVEMVRVVNSLLDGIASGYAGQKYEDRATPHTFRNVTTYRTARNGFSLTGGNSPTFENCTFEDAGNCPNTTAPNGARLSSPPASCFDLEPESAAQIRNATFIRCNFVAGLYSSTAFVADVGTASGVYLKACFIDGALWTRKPFTVFEDCTINGQVLSAIGGLSDQTANTRFTRCSMSDVTTVAPREPSGGKLFMDLGAAGAGVVVEDGYISLMQTRISWRGVITRGQPTIAFRFGTNTAPNGQYAMLAEGANWTDGMPVFIDQIGSFAGDAPSGLGYFIQLSDASVGRARIVPGAGYKLKFVNPDPAQGANGFPHAGAPDGLFANGAAAREQRISLSRGGGQGFYGGQGEAQISYGPALPGADTLGIGSKRLNQAPVAGAAGEWVKCADGTYRPLGIVGAVRATSLTASSTPADIVAALQAAGLAQ